MMLLRALLLVVALLAAASSAAAANPVQIENALAGTPGWKYADASRGTVADQYAGTVKTIDGWTSTDSVAPGQQLELHVSTVAGVAYRVEVYRLGWYGGVGARRIACTPGCGTSKAGIQQAAPPAPNPTTGFVETSWAVTDTLTVGSNWLSGYYVAQLHIISGPGAGTSRWVPFVVRGPAGDTTPIVMIVPTNTWQSYNGWGGKSLYDNKSVDGVRASRVSFDRPYWGNMFDLFDHEYQTVRFLEREGYHVTYVADSDVDANPSVLLGRSAVIVNGHGEYWTLAQRTALDSARDAGVSLAFIGANIGYWHVRLEDGRRTLVGYKSNADPIADPTKKTILFRDLGKPECQLLGVQYENSWSTDAVVRSFTVDGAAINDPWFSGTGVTAGEALNGTVGYEWDFIVPGCQSRPLTRLFVWDGTPTGFPDAEAVRYTAASGARVFAAASLHFNFGLDGWRYGANTGSANPKVQQFMRNVLADMTGSPPPPPPPNTPPTAGFTVAPQAPFTGQLVTFTDTSTDADGSIASRSWDLNGDGAFGDATGATATITYTTPGAVTARLRVTDDDGAPATITKVVAVTAAPPNVPPVAAFTVSPAAPVAGQLVTFTDTSTDGDDGIASRSWDLDGDGVFGDATGPTATRTYTAGGTVTVGLTVTDAGGSSATITAPVTVTPVRPPDVTGPEDPVVRPPVTTSRVLAITHARVTRRAGVLRVAVRTSQSARVSVRVLRCRASRCRVVIRERAVRGGVAALRLPARPAQLRVVVTASARGQATVRRTLRVPGR